jgi:hypothetical protein
VRSLRRPVVAVMSGTFAMALAVAGCSAADSTGSDGDEPASAVQQDAPTEQPEQQSDEADEAEEPTDAGGSEQSKDVEVSKPGAALKLGEAGVVPVASGTDKKGVVSVTVTVEEGDPADLAPLKLGDRAAGLVPYYVRFTFEKVEGDDLGYGSYHSDFYGTTSDGSRAAPLSVFGDWKVCDSESAPAEFDEGESYESCRAFLVPEATEVNGVSYEGRDGPYENNPVTWGS